MRNQKRNQKPNQNQSRKQNRIARLAPSILLAGTLVVGGAQMIASGNVPRLLAGTPPTPSAAPAPDFSTDHNDRLAANSFQNDSTQTAKFSGSGSIPLPDSSGNDSILLPNSSEKDNIKTSLAVREAVVCETSEFDNNATNNVSFAERFACYEAFGMTYDAEKEELWYQGELVRWFEDYYPVGEGGSAGNDFFHENGTVDVYALRDFSNLTKNEDGSFDPSGKLIGLAKFSAEAFAARDVNAIKNPIECTFAGSAPSTQELQEQLQEMAAEYAAFGLVYDEKTNLWYWNGEMVHSFLDVLTSNGEALDSGRFHGTIRKWCQDSGTVDVCTVRDFDTSGDDGIGKLTEIRKYEQ